MKDGRKLSSRGIKNTILLEILEKTTPPKPVRKSLTFKEWQNEQDRQK